MILCYGHSFNNPFIFTHSPLTLLKKNYSRVITYKHETEVFEMCIFNGLKSQMSIIIKISSLIDFFFGNVIVYSLCLNGAQNLCQV